MGWGVEWGDLFLLAMITRMGYGDLDARIFNVVVASQDCAARRCDSASAASNAKREVRPGH